MNHARTYKPETESLWHRSKGDVGIKLLEFCLYKTNRIHILVRGTELLKLNRRGNKKKSTWRAHTRGLQRGGGYGVPADPAGTVTKPTG